MVLCREFTTESIGLFRANYLDLVNFSTKNQEAEQVMQGSRR